MAGIHRLLAEEPVLQAADVILVVAGMEGALASAVGGLAAAPIIAVPTSAGYGSSLEGVTALLAMLASCAPGVAVMGIDNGYGAACAAARILAALERARTPTPMTGVPAQQTFRCGENAGRPPAHRRPGPGVHLRHPSVENERRRAASP